MSALVQQAPPTIEEHPGVQAWLHLGRGKCPSRVELVGRPWRRAKSAVWRFIDSDAQGRTVVAKQARTETIAVESRIYLDILSGRGLDLPECFGHVEHRDGTSWLFLNLVSGVRYAEGNHAHRAAASAWLGRMHQGTHERPGGAEHLPAVTLDRYEAYVDFARTTIARHVGPETPAEAIDAHATALRVTERLASAWPTIEAAWAASPSCLVHGDFISKNVLIDERDGQCQVRVFDWEASGWGVPLEDLAGLDAGAYWEQARAMWDGFALADLRRLIAVGEALRAIAFLSTYARGLEEHWYGDAEQFVTHAAELTAALDVFAPTHATETD